MVHIDDASWSRFTGCEETKRLFSLVLPKLSLHEATELIAYLFPLAVFELRPERRAVEFMDSQQRPLLTLVESTPQGC